MAVDDSITNTQQQVYNGDHRKYFEIPCIVCVKKSAIELNEDKVYYYYVNKWNWGANEIMKTTTIIDIIGLMRMLCNTNRFYLYHSREMEQYQLFGKLLAID